MAERKTQAEYGRAASQEELAKSGYKLPDHFFVEAKPDGSGSPSTEEMSARERIAARRKKREGATSEEESSPVTPVIENKVVTPKRKTAAKKAPAKRK